MAVVELLKEIVDKQGKQGPEQTQSHKALAPATGIPAKTYDADELTSPRFWQDRVKERDDQINKLNLMLNETEGKLQGHVEISSQRHSTITQLEAKAKVAIDESAFYKGKVHHLEQSVQQKNLVIEQLMKKVDFHKSEITVATNMNEQQLQKFKKEQDQQSHSFSIEKDKLEEELKDLRSVLVKHKEDALEK